MPWAIRLSRSVFAPPSSPRMANETPTVILKIRGQYGLSVPSRLKEVGVITLGICPCPWTPGDKDDGPGPCGHLPCEYLAAWEVSSLIDRGGSGEEDAHEERRTLSVERRMAVSLPWALCAQRQIAVRCLYLQYREDPPEVSV